MFEWCLVLRAALLIAAGRLSVRPYLHGPNCEFERYLSIYHVHIMIVAIAQCTHPLDDGSILRLMHTQKTIKAHPNQSLSSQLHALATPNKSHLRTKVIANIFQQRNYKANALDLRSSSRNKLMLHALR